MHTLEALKTEVMTANDTLTRKQWEEKIYSRGLEHKFDKQLIAAAKALVETLNSLDEMMADITVRLDKEDLVEIDAKKIRIRDKLAAVIKEQEFRAAGSVERTPVGTIYYCDYVGGSDANTGLTTGQSWKTLQQYTTVTVRSPGDILKLRANVTWDYSNAGENVNISSDESGTISSNIEIRGCDSVDDPWSDASDVQALIDFGGDNHYFFWTGAGSYWTFRNFEMKDGKATNQGMFYNSWTSVLSFYKILAHGGFYYGMNFGGDNSNYFEECEFHTNGSYSVQLSGGGAVFQSCVFNGGSGAGTNYAALIRNNQYFIDCSFGQTTAHNSGTFYATWGIVYAQNCLLDADEGYIGGGFTCGIISEDHNQVKGDSRFYSTRGLVRSERTVVRPGGAPVSAAMLPSSGCSSARWDRFLRLGNNVISGGLKVWCDPVLNSASVWIRSKDVWSVYPTNAELFIQASYLSDAVTGERSTSTPSTEVLADETTWVEFTVSFTPAQAGWAYIQVNLGKVQDPRGCYVDTKPVMS